MSSLWMPPPRVHADVSARPWCVRSAVDLPARRDHHRVPVQVPAILSLFAAPKRWPTLSNLPCILSLWVRSASAGACLDPFAAPKRWPALSNLPCIPSLWFRSAVLLGDERMDQLALAGAPILAVLPSFSFLSVGISKTLIRLRTHLSPSPSPCRLRYRVLRTA